MLKAWRFLRRLSSFSERAPRFEGFVHLTTEYVPKQGRLQANHSGTLLRALATCGSMLDPHPARRVHREGGRGECE
jgi:hypothetical protein